MIYGTTTIRLKVIETVLVMIIEKMMKMLVVYLMITIQESWTWILKISWRYVAQSSACRFQSVRRSVYIQCLLFFFYRIVKLTVLRTILIR